MNTKQIIKQMEKELAIHEWGAECLGSVSDYMEPIDKIVKPHIRTLLESFGEEIIGNAGENYIEWRIYVEKEYSKGRKDKKPKLILGYSEWLEEKQRLKVKEIISSIGK